MYTILLVIHTILVVFLILMVLIQRTDSDGLSGLGGGGGNQFMTGRGAANFMTRTTAILAAAFMVTSLSLAVMASHMTRTSIIDTAVPLETAPVPVEAPKAKAVEENKAKPEQKTPAVPKPE